MRLIRLALLVLAVVLVCGTRSSAAPAMEHPNLLLNRQELEQIREKIRKYPWAAQALELEKKLATEKNDLRALGLCYQLTGEKAYADKARAQLVFEANSWLSQLKAVDFKANREWGAFGGWGSYAWAYDLTYDTFSPAERQVVEDWLRRVAKLLMDDCKAWTTTPNLVFGIHFQAGLVGYCLGDPAIIDWALHDPGDSHGPEKGGFYPVLDSMIRDRQFWGEAPVYALIYDVHGMLALGVAARHYDGRDLLHYVSPKSGGSIKSLIDGYLLMAYPLQQTGVGQGLLRMATFGDGSTFYDARGTEQGTIGAAFENLTGPYYLTDMELGWQIYHDPAYAWVLSLPPDRTTSGGQGRAVWGYPALSNGEPLPVNPAPPPAPSGVYPGEGFAILRADESPSYWTTGALAAVVRFGQALPHGHRDFYGLTLHGKGRLLYPDLNPVQYEANYLGWSRDGIGHSTLLVDQASPKPGPFTTTNDFNADIKFFAITGSAYPGVQQTRRLLLTKEYLVDVFHAVDPTGQSHRYDWVVHGLGRLYPGQPTAYAATDALLPHYWWVDHERGRVTDDGWSVDWIQRTASITEGLQWGKEWFTTEVGVRLSMLGQTNTGVYYGDGPITQAPPFGMIDGNPEPALPLVVARRQGAAATFTAVHEPYRGAPKIRRVQRLAESDQAVMFRVQLPEATDYVCVGFDDQSHSLTAAEGEAFTFTGYAYLHVGKGGPVVRGKVTAFRVDAKVLNANHLLLNGRRVAVRRAGAFSEFGALPKATAPDRSPVTTNTPSPVASATDGSGAVAGLSPGGARRPSEDSASPLRGRGRPRVVSGTGEGEFLEPSPALHYWFLPNEVHLSALKETDAREITLHLRCVGGGPVAGRLRAVVPASLSVEPPVLEVPALGEGAERVVKLTVRKTAKLAKGLQTITFVPEGLTADGPALTVSAGVVITEDRRRPLNAQYVVRAPGYMLDVDFYSGVSYYLLDADGHRRHGAVYCNFAYGFPGIEGIAKYLQPCQFIWPGEAGLRIGYATMRPAFSFYEDRYTYVIGEYADPTKTYTVWFGSFDSLENPVHKTKPPDAAGKGGGEWYFFAHPVYRQGFLLTVPPKTVVGFSNYNGVGISIPVKKDQEVSAQFVTKEEFEALGK